MRSPGPSVKRLGAHTFLTGWETLGPLLRLIQSSSIGNMCCFLPGYASALPAQLHCRHQCHTHAPSFSFAPSLQISAAEVHCYFIKAAAATGDLVRAGYLVNGALLWAGDTGWSSPIFLIEGFNTSYGETAVLQISTFPVTLTNVLLGLGRSSDSFQSRRSCPPPRHRHLNRQTHTHLHTSWTRALARRGRVIEALVCDHSA